MPHSRRLCQTPDVLRNSPLSLFKKEGSSISPSIFNQGVEIESLRAVTNKFNPIPTAIKQVKIGSIQPEKTSSSSGVF